MKLMINILAYSHVNNFFFLVTFFLTFKEEKDQNCGTVQRRGEPGEEDTELLGSPSLKKANLGVPVRFCHCVSCFLPPLVSVFG